MTPIRDTHRVLDWHIPALAFFGIGTALGVAFAVAGPVVGIRALGLAATLSGGFGLAMVLYALRLEDPVRWDALMTGLAARVEVATERWNALWVRRHTFDRYLQGAVWSGMN